MRSKSRAVAPEAVAIPTDGHGDIAGLIWTPPVAPIGLVVIHPATATPARFYAAFSEFLAEHGHAVLTYDYRGTGASGDPRQFAAVRMRDWMAIDAAAVTAFADERFPDLPTVTVGHGLGGHALILGAGGPRVSRFMTVSSHLAVTSRITPATERWRVAMVLNVLGPVLSRALGVMPGRRLGLGEDIPSAAMLEWGRWARLPHYFFSDPTMDAAARAARFSGEVLAIGASDDPWSSSRQIDALMANLTGARVERRTITPAEVGVERLGHHGLFRRGVGERAWPGMLAWLTAARS